jgi:hypothetical protein
MELPVSRSFSPASRPAISQGWFFYWLPNPNSGTFGWNFYPGPDESSISDYNAIQCIGSQSNWPVPAIAFSQSDNEIEIAVSRSSSHSGSDAGTAGQRIVFYEPEIPGACPLYGGTCGMGTPAGCSCSSGGATAAPSYTNPDVCTTNGVFCACGTSPCTSSDYPTNTVDEILPQLAYDGSNKLGVAWYDDRVNSASGRLFGNIYGQSSSNHHTNGFPSPAADVVILTTDDKESDAEAVNELFIGFAQQNAASHWFGGSHGADSDASLYNWQFGQ